MIRIASATLLLASLATIASPLRAADANWPREITRGDGTAIAIYAPEYDSLDGDTLLSRSAVSIKRPGDKSPLFGAVETTAKLDIDGDHARIVDLTVDRVRLPGMRADSDEARELAAALEREVPRWNLDLSMADLEARIESQASAQDLRNTPPKFIYVDEPAILISIDGEPRLRAVGGTGLERVVNTPFPVVFDRASKRYYFYGSSVWFATSDLTRGRWSQVSRPPANVVAFFTEGAQPADRQRTAADGGRNTPPLSAEQLRRARIFVATEPTELISTDGQPAMQPIVGSELLTVTNTDSDLFFDVPGQTWYIVVSGRWYRAPSLTGSWSFVDSDRLPASFARIPPSSPKADALAYVAGTEAANDAVMDSAVPQVAAVDRRDAHFNATYDGAPRFEPIPRTDLRYAVNTASQVFLADGRYYAVEQGIWYVADSPYGPWEVSETRPVGIDDIPPSSPAYNTRYVYIYDVQPDVIYMGYTPGYLWAFPYGGAVVYGTGYRYRPWYGPDWYYPRPWTWGFSVHYSPWFGWNYGMSWNAGWIGLSWAWGDSWGQWRGYRRGYWNGYDRGYRHGYWDGVHSGGWFGPGGYRPPVYAPRRPHYRPDARPVKGPGGHYAAPQRWADNLYTRPHNANFATTRPAARYWNDPSGGRLLRPSNGQRPETIRTRPATEHRPADRPADRPTDRRMLRPSSPPNETFADRDENVRRGRSNEWRSTDERDAWRPAAPASSSRPTYRPGYRQAPPVRPAQPAARPEPQIERRSYEPRPYGGNMRVPAQPARPQPQARPPERQDAPAQVRPRDGGAFQSGQGRRERGPLREP
ncbi:MAG: hypothetical protein CMLOHMNK_02216 [Steroidobacteraceae bacterium]|nr:hypothetical protein [Steroidobacteraceae bacterium]